MSDPAADFVCREVRWPVQLKSFMMDSGSRSYLTCAAVLIIHSSLGLVLGNCMSGYICIKFCDQRPASCAARDLLPATGEL